MKSKEQLEYKENMKKLNKHWFLNMLLSLFLGFLFFFCCGGRRCDAISATVTRATKFMHYKSSLDSFLVDLLATSARGQRMATSVTTATKEKQKQVKHEKQETSGQPMNNMNN